MAPNASDDPRTPLTEADADEARSRRRRTAARYVVPVTVVGVAAATIGLVPALADSGDPDLPQITAQQLLDKVAASDVQQLSGTVKITTDLGLPDLGGLESSFLSGATGSSEGSSADPTTRLTELAAGTHTLRVATDGPEKQKLSLLENAAEYSLIHNGKDVWGYDSKSNEVYHSTLSEKARKESQAPATPKDLTEETLKAIDPTTSVKVDGSVHVAGRDAYKLVVTPKQSGSTVGAISIAVDAKTGLPLKFTLTPRSGGAAVIDAGFTQVSFDKPAASTFDFTAPKGAKVTEGDTIHGDEGKDAPGKGGPAEGALGEDLTGLNVLGKGWTTIATYDTGTNTGIPSSSDLPDAGALGGFLDSFGDKVSGDFGKGTVFSTRLVNALVTDNGKVYVGAVTKDALVKAAEGN
ncbi:outer membrane lipoprotein carrier protein LolA [Streptomyces sp. V2]|uniref:Outer-membrane lipoprotein carrier protein LolA n=1 Tax=Streptomyces niveiscabiei TaxID=164115 RepID=A0ABW9HZU3_9ACTN|nr:MULTISPECIES: outer-membrane lipoprotein carrier protein LolA [Streptomyces]PWG08959.1 outer membrane lipoprotein carrier protein LolA [Streptomyces sp. V2]